MSLASRLFGRPGGTKFDLAAVQVKLTDAVRRSGPADAELARARFADGCRDAGVRPPTPEEWAATTNGIDADGWQRFAVMVAVFDWPQFRETVPQLPAGKSGTDLTAAFAWTITHTPLLTVEVLTQSELRVEELARRLVSAVGGSIAGESAAESKVKAERLDYGRLLAEAEEAKAAAAERTEELRKRREEQEQRRTRRGKF